MAERLLEVKYTFYILLLTPFLYFFCFLLFFFFFLIYWNDSGFPVLCLVVMVPIE